MSIQRKQLSKPKNPEVKEVLVDFAFKCISEDVEDIFPFGIKYFYSLDEERRSKQQEEMRKSMARAERLSSRKYDLLGRDTFYRIKARASVQSNGPVAEINIPKSEDERQFLYGVLETAVLFRAIPEEHYDEIIDSFSMLRFTKNDIVINQFEFGTRFYVVQEGTFEVYIGDEPGEEGDLVETYKNSGYFGELALLYDQPRAASVKAVSDAVVWVMNQVDFNRLIRKDVLKHRKKNEQLVDLVPILQELTPYQRMALADALVVKDFPKETVIYKQGDEAHGMYFIKEGVVVLSHSDENAKDRDITALTGGSYFGELEIFQECPRIFSAETITDATVAFLDTDSFDQVMAPCKDMMRQYIVEYMSRFKKEVNLPTIKFARLSEGI